MTNLYFLNDWGQIVAVLVLCLALPIGIITCIMYIVRFYEHEYLFVIVRLCLCICFRVFPCVFLFNFVRVY